MFPSQFNNYVGVVPPVDAPSLSISDPSGPELVDYAESIASLSSSTEAFYSAMSTFSSPRSGTMSLTVPNESQQDTSQSTAVIPIPQPKLARASKSSTPLVHSGKLENRVKLPQKKSIDGDKPTAQPITKSKKALDALIVTHSKQVQAAKSKVVKSSNSQSASKKKTNAGSFTLDKDLSQKPSLLASDFKEKTVCMPSPNLAAGDSNVPKRQTNDILDTEPANDVVISTSVKPEVSFAATPAESTPTKKRKKKKKKSAPNQVSINICKDVEIALVRKDMVAKVLDNEKLHVNVLYLRVQLQNKLFANLNEMIIFLEKENMFSVDDCWVECCSN